MSWLEYTKMAVPVLVAAHVAGVLLLGLGTAALRLVERLKRPHGR